VPQIHAHTFAVSLPRKTKYFCSIHTTHTRAKALSVSFPLAGERASDVGGWWVERGWCGGAGGAAFSLSSKFSTCNFSRTLSLSHRVENLLDSLALSLLISVSLFGYWFSLCLITKLFIFLVISCLFFFVFFWLRKCRKTSGKTDQRRRVKNDEWRLLQKLNSTRRVFWRID